MLRAMKYWFIKPSLSNGTIAAIAALAFMLFSALLNGVPMAPESEVADTSNALDMSQVYYPNCNAAWDAGVAPIDKGQPGYRRELDGDSDGIACEPWSGHTDRATSSRNGSTYYANCNAARAAGAAPIYRGEPGYRSALDRDNDGIACEPYYGHRKRN
jgi:Excalibur calcium-binding domain